jgi:site-specific DNA recombinase
MMVQMLGVFAEFERATIIERVIGGMERKAARGGWNGGGVPWGYRFDRETGFLETNPDEAVLVPVVFDLYLNQRLGARSIANWLNERGHRTRGGKPWSFKLIFTILRNRVYLGEVFFRDRWFPAPHPPLVDVEVFNGVQALLDQRGEDHAKRRSNPSDYLLGGLVVCAGCGRHYVGTAARGKIYNYRYYTCYSRQRYGTDTCPAERIDAGRLDAVVLESLLQTYKDQRLLDEAVDEYMARSRAAKPQRQEQAAALEAEIKRAEEALDRYFNAFETGKMNEDLCRPRIEALAERLRGLRARRSELMVVLEDDLAGPSPEELEILRAKIRHAIDEGPSTLRKAVLQELVVEVRVKSRRVIHPTFRLPLHGVRELSQMVEAAGVEPASEAASPGTSTSVSGILLSPLGSSRRDP